MLKMILFAFQREDVAAVSQCRRGDTLSMPPDSYISNIARIPRIVRSVP